MGDGCKPKNLVAITRAANQIQGDIFTEAERVKNFSGEQRFHYEKVMSSYFGISTKKKGSSRLDVLKRRTKIASQPEGVMDDRLYARPSEQFSKKFMGGIDRKMNAYYKKGGDYQEDVAKPMRTLQAALDQIVANSKSRSDLNRQLSRFGLDADTIYDARDYVKWLAEGGPTQKSWATALTNKAAIISKAQANMNLAWTLGNSTDLIRVYSHYATQPGGLKAILKGTAEAISKNPFKRDPKLKEVYQSQYLDQQGGNNDPFSWSITAQKNITYHIDKAAGGDGKTGARELLFDSTPWDRPRYDRSPEANLVFGLARYPINEARWHYKTVKQALQGDARAAANYGLYLIAKGAMLGAASLIPAPVYQAMPKEMRDQIEETEKQYGTNLFKRVSGAAFEKAGINANIDLASYTQPGGGQLGARAASLVNTGASVVKNTAKAGMDAVQGNIPAATVNAIAAASAFVNFTGYKADVLGVANSTTITELFETTGKELEQEFDSDRYSRNMVKAVFGQRNVKKNTNDVPELPKLPAIK